MRNLLTKKGSFIKAFLFVPALTIMLFYTGCVSAGDEVQSFRRGDSSKADKELTFYDYRDGDEIKWKVYFKNDEISALYKDGRKLSKDEIKNYSSMIYDKLKDLTLKRKGKLRVYSYEDGKLKPELDKLYDSLKKQSKEIKIKVDGDLKEEMKKLSVEMKKLKDKEFHVMVNPERFKSEMKDLNIKLKRLHPDSEDSFSFRFDSENLDKQLEKLAEDLKDLKIDINIPDIEIDLRELDKSLSKLDVELGDLDAEIKNLNNFLDELKSELVKDGLIESSTEDIKLKIEKDKIYINGRAVSEAQYNKYKELYKKHTGKEFEGMNYFRLN